MFVLFDTIRDTTHNTYNKNINISNVVSITESNQNTTKHSNYKGIKKGSKHYVDISKIVPLDSILKKCRKNKSGGCQSTITFHDISNTHRTIIENEIEHSIQCNILTQKHYTNEHEFLRGGVKGQIYREIKCLKTLYKYKHFPLLLSTKDRSIVMSYCGVPIDDKNIPTNWKVQVREIVHTMKELKVYNNDIWKNNFLVKDKILTLIDFGWGSETQKYPFQNIKDSDIEEYDDLIELLGRVYRRSIKNKIFDTYRFW